RVPGRGTGEATMSSPHYVHPEFGYLCPTPRFRRELRLVVVSVLAGIVIGAGFTIKASYEREHAREAEASGMTAAGGSGSSAPAEPREPGRAQPEGRGNPPPPTGAARIRLGESGPDASKNGIGREPAAADAGTRRSRLRAATDTPAIATAPLGRPSG